MNQYSFVKNLNDGQYLKSFDKLSDETFDITFEGWKSKGYWSDRYVPYSLVDGDEVIANVSANIMHFYLGDKKVKAIQIGTVMTKKEYRRQGLSRVLMEKVIAEYEDNCDFIYLFANDTALDFYPKFGFVRGTEYLCEATYKRNPSIFNPRKLNIDNSDDYNLFIGLIKNNKPAFRLTMSDNENLVMFYCEYPMRGSIYHIPELDLAVVAKFDGDTLHVNDIFCEKSYDLDEVVNSLLKADTTNVTFGFTPMNTDNMSIREKIDEDPLFIRSKEKIQLGKAMFPKFSHA